MFGFGDSLLFLAVFGLAAAAALFFLRPRPAFWLTLSVAALVVATTSVAAFLVQIGPRVFSSPYLLQSWSGFVPLRIFVAPLFAIFFLLSGLIAPNRSARISLILATTIETAVFAYVTFTWFHP